MGEYDDIVERLAAIEEDLRDRALDRLRDAAGDPDSDVAADAQRAERRLLQARRAIARAIGALSDRADEADEL
jgi:hypothetical protein